MKTLEEWFSQRNDMTLLLSVLILSIITYITGYNVAEYIITSISILGLWHGFITVPACWIRLIAVAIIVIVYSVATGECTKKHAPAKVIGGKPEIARVFGFIAKILNVIAVIVAVVLLITNFTQYGFGWALIYGFESVIFWEILSSAAELVKYFCSTEEQFVILEKDVE